MADDRTRPLKKKDPATSGCYASDLVAPRNSYGEKSHLPATPKTKKNDNRYAASGNYGSDANWSDGTVKKPDTEYAGSGDYGTEADYGNRNSGH